MHISRFLSTAILIAIPTVASSSEESKKPSIEEVAAADSLVKSQERIDKPECASCNYIEIPELRQYATGDGPAISSNGMPRPPEPILAILYSYQKGNGVETFLAEFSRNPLKKLASGRVGAKGWREVQQLLQIRYGGVELKTMSYSPHDADCCPTVPGTTTYFEDAGHLQEDGTIIDVESWTGPK